MSSEEGTVLNEVLNSVKELKTGQVKMQSCIDGLTEDVKGLCNDVKDIKDRTSTIEYKLNHFVK